MADRYTPEDAKRVEKALACELLRRQEWLNIRDDDFARILSVSDADLARMKAGETVICHDAKSFRVGISFVRLGRSLCALVHGDRDAARAWLNNRNTALADVPLYLIQDCAGLNRVIDYRQSHRSLT